MESVKIIFNSVLLVISLDVEDGRHLVDKGNAVIVYIKTKHVK